MRALRRWRRAWPVSPAPSPAPQIPDRTTAQSIRSVTRAGLTPGSDDMCRRVYSAESWRVFGPQSGGVAGPPSPPVPWSSMPARRGSIPASSTALDAISAASASPFPSSPSPPGRDGDSAPGLVRFLSALMHHLAVSGKGRSGHATSRGPRRSALASSLSIDVRDARRSAGRRADPSSSSRGMGPSFSSWSDVSDESRRA
mmetsp:Transcript_27094/g.61755  ORF Transcript_27094/g.61755 Transcript_27094/m.61755 type:complete len:200 (-) Transcript_27094:61-660(-)